MKNKMKKIIVVLVAIVTISSSNSYAGETYAAKGALIGGIVAGVAGGVAGAAIGSKPFFCTDDFGGGCKSSTTSTIEVGLIAGAASAAVGAGIGALIGLAIPKHPKISVAPLFIQSKTEGNTTGGSVAFHF